MNREDQGKSMDLMYICKFWEIFVKFVNFKQNLVVYVARTPDVLVYQSLNTTLLYEMIYYRCADDGNQAVRSGHLDIMNNLAPNATKCIGKKVSLHSIN